MSESKTEMLDEEDYLSEDWARSLATFSTPSLQSKLKSLQEKSNNLSSTLTARLASSPAGQSLLHIGPSLSSLPPDLQTLLSNLEPMVNQVAEFKLLNQREFHRIVSTANTIKLEYRRNVHARECADLLQELEVSERILLEEFKEVDTDGNPNHDSSSGYLSNLDLHEKETNYMVSLERVSHTTLYLMNQLNLSSDHVTQALHASTSKKIDESTTIDIALPQDIEKAQFIMNLAPRIRSLEDNLCQVLKSQLERILKNRLRRRNLVIDEDIVEGTSEMVRNDVLLLGNLFRSFALLDKGSDAELLFSQIAILPVVKSKLSLGKLDEGGSRGECAGLFGLMQDIILEVRTLWGDIIQFVESMFHISSLRGQTVAIDLVAAGVWVPLATSLMTDSSIQLAIFSPGIASILQANYLALDTIVSELASSVLSPSAKDTVENDAILSSRGSDVMALTSLYYEPEINEDVIASAQQRIYEHSISIDFFKKWNLPIYYQLRFGEACTRVEKAISLVLLDGWYAEVYTGADSRRQFIHSNYGFQFPFFAEFIDTICWLWNSDVFVKPLTHRFLRGAVQIIFRVLSFINEGLKGDVVFGAVQTEGMISNKNQEEQGSTSSLSDIVAGYSWKDRIEDVASISWELFVLSSFLNREYATIIMSAVSPNTPTTTSSTTSVEISNLINDLLCDTAKDISPIITQSWNEIIVDSVTNDCVKPLSSVKGVAATYRMTNRPAPKLPSPYVQSILRPLKDFDSKFANRVPGSIGLVWKERIVETVVNRYSLAVSELFDTVKKTEDALKNRNARVMGGDGMSDGDKVRLQLYLDQEAFTKDIVGVGLDPNTFEGIQSLRETTRSSQDKS